MAGPSTPLGAREATVTAADIARLANVQRAAVSNWRRRHAGFPPPVGGSAASPLFSLSAVEVWFAERGRSFDVAPVDRLWQHVRGAVDHIRLAELVGLLGLVLVAWHRGHRSRDVESTLHAVLPELPAILVPAVEPEWVPLLWEATDLADASGPGTLLDYVIQRFTETQARAHLGTGSDVAELMCSLAGISGDDAVLDPACRTGALLHAAAERGARHVIGQNTDASLARIGLARLLLTGASARVTAAHSLLVDPDPGLLADAVLSDLPVSDRLWRQECDRRWAYGLPPRAEPELAWIQHCLAHVKPGGLVVVTMPSAAANRRSGIRIRRNLVRSGALCAVVNLPPDRFATAPDLWILCRPKTGEVEPNVLFVSHPADLATIESAWRAFQADEDVSGHAQKAAGVDVLDETTDLRPEYHCGRREIVNVAHEFDRIRAEVATELSTLAAGIPRLTSANRASDHIVTVADLLNSGVLTSHQAPLAMAISGGDIPVLTAKDVSAGRAPTGATSEQPGLVPIEVNDVVLPIAVRTRHVRVIAEAGAALGPQLLLLRPAPGQIDPEFLAGFVRIAQLSAFPHGRGSHRFDVRKAEIPALPLPEQRRFGTVFHQLNAFQDNVRRLAELAEMLEETGLTGLGSGSLTPAEN